MLNVKICHLRPPPHVSMSQRFHCDANTACASASHCGWPAGGFWKFVSAAVIADMPQKPWSSLPSDFDALAGM